MRLFANRMLFPRRTEAEPDATRWALWRWFDIPGPGKAGLYLRRLTVLRTPWFQVLLHWIYLPDPDRGLHNHPWRFLTIPLRGHYIEEVGEPGRFGGWVGPVRLRLVRWFGWKGLRHAHRIVALCGRSAVTLVLTGGKKRSWGFFDRTTGQYTPWRKYLGLDS